MLIGLAVFDIVGEFVAQGRVCILVNVSFVAAAVLLFLTEISSWSTGGVVNERK